MEDGQRIGEWTAATNANFPINSSYSYFSIPFPNLYSLIKNGSQSSPELGDLLVKWSHCFSIDKFDVGRTGPPYTIKTITGKPYKGYNPRRSPGAIAAIRSEVNKMLRADLIEESISPYSSPMVCVPKPDGNIRVCIDFRQINQDIVNDAYPMHRIEEQLDSMTGCNVFSTLDLTKGYHQLIIDEKSKEVTAFSTPDGLYQWKVLPLGMKTSGAVFQRLMDNVFRGLQPNIVVVYIDDVTVFLKNMKQHVKDLDLVFERIHQANLKVSYSKCSIAQSKVKVLGHLISGQGIQPNPEKVEAICRIKSPTSVKGIKSFLGAVSFFRRFLPQLSSIAEPLWNLCRKNVPFRWDDEKEATFQKLKQMLGTAPVLQLPDWNRMFKIETDASGTGLGAVLTQEDPDGSWPVAYASRTLRGAESRYSATEKEALAVVWAVDHFKSYVMGNAFLVVTDHAPLKALRTKKNLEGRLMRFAEKLAVYDYDIIYRPGKENAVADLLSRALNATNPGQISPTSEQNEATRRNRIFIDPTRRLQVVRDAHVRFGGHFRRDKLTQMVKSRFYWHGMEKEIEQVL